MAMMMMNNVQDVIQEVGEQKERKLMEQLGWLVDRDLLVIVETKPTLVQKPGECKFEIVGSVELKVKDHEYIEKLENENVELKEKLERIGRCFS